VGLVENQIHQTVIVKAMTADTVLQTETELLQKAKACFPQLPLDAIDLLIVDELGKDISGAGMDPNVTGRVVSAVCSQPEGPNVSRILVRDLTDASEGNAIGIGSADVITQRLLDKVDFEATAINCLTSCSPEDGRIPLSYATDRQAIAAALMTIRPHTMENVKIVQIKNTLDLSDILVSKGCFKDLAGKPGVLIDAEDLRLEFDAVGNLASILS